MERLTIGEVLKPQGIRGELKIKTFTDFPEDVKAFGTVYIDEKPYKILSFRAGEGGFAYLGLRGVPDRNAAELLRGRKIEGDREDAPELEEGRYYIADLLGAAVVTESGELLGTVKDIARNNFSAIKKRNVKGFLAKAFFPIRGDDGMERLTIGEVLKPQGIRGELKIKTFTDFPEDVKAFGTVYIDEKPYKILSFRAGEGGFAYLGLRGVPDRNAAELLRGRKIEGDREDAPELEEGRYYIADLLGAAVVTESGELLGTVKDIAPLSSEVYTLEKDGKQILFPAVKGVVKRVEIAEKRLIVDKKRFDEVAVY